jgi:hypothetical protein
MLLTRYRHIIYRSILLLISGFAIGALSAQDSVSLNAAGLKLLWKKQAKGWSLNRLMLRQKDGWKAVNNLSGEYTLLYSANKPDTTPVTLTDAAGKAISFPEPQYRYIIPSWKEALSPVELNRAGEPITYYPDQVKQQANGLTFSKEHPLATMTAVWSTEKKYSNDVVVTISITAKQPGYYSIASPVLNTTDESQLAWATVPGVFQGNAINNNFVNAFAYGQGIPALPVMVRERTAATLAAIVTANNGTSYATIAAPGTGRDPWASDKKTLSDWQLGLSVMDRSAHLTPVLYHPVLGEKGSYLQAGETVSFSFRYTIQQAGWHKVFSHAAQDIYRFSDFLALKQTKRSLTDRIFAMQHYVASDSTSKWRVEDYKGIKIGAQDYLGGVYGAEKGAVKNADYGAMWMLTTISDDSVLRTTRLPYARNFKLMQQQKNNNFFNGAAAGQYYLYNGKRFTEEWGPYSEPIGTTYYMLMDIGNVLLFQPNDTAMRKALRCAADKLLSWMNDKGQWQVAYDNQTTRPLFTDVQDLRPTFYGLLIAYKLLKEEKYLAAATKGADWYIQHAIEKGHFLGVCGDTRFAPDFATGQSVQALLDLYEITHQSKYKDAALQAVQIYTASIYTHPIPSKQIKKVNGVQREDWEISQAGLSFEHGGILGSANTRGPILLASHAGMFARLFSITKDSLYLQMARAAALGRDAFVDPSTGVASYYWDVMNKGAGPYPHHAWWQIGWIMDYLIAEAALRSNGNIDFPAGFITPKVGPHRTYGFSKGLLHGHKVQLLLREGLIRIDNPYIDHFSAIDTAQGKLYFILLNNDDEVKDIQVSTDYTRLWNHQQAVPTAGYLMNEKGVRSGKINTTAFSVNIAPYGLRVVEISFQKKGLQTTGK